jgi:predicted transcriptional regulator of viral defense system
MEMGEAFELLSEYTGEQWGMVTARQAKSLGVDAVTLHRLKEAGFLDLVRRGVYAATSAVADEQQPEQAAWLALRPATPAWDRDPLDAALSHGTAVRLHGLGELVNDRIAFTVPSRRTSRDTDLWFKLDASLGEDDVTQVDGLPVTTVLRTVCDLLDQHIDASHVATIIREAVEAGKLRLDDLADRLAPYARRYRARLNDGTALLEHLLGQIGLTIDDLAARPRPRRARIAVGATDSLPASALAGLAAEAQSVLDKNYDAGVLSAAMLTGTPLAGPLQKQVAEYVGPTRVFEALNEEMAQKLARLAEPASELVRRAIIQAAQPTMLAASGVNAEVQRMLDAAIPAEAMQRLTGNLSELARQQAGWSPLAPAPRELNTATEDDPDTRDESGRSDD